VQLHGTRTTAEIEQVRREAPCEVRAVALIAAADVPDHLDELFASASGAALVSLKAGVLGGSGATFDWRGGRERIAAARNGRRVILAGGLTPENVADGIRLLEPDVVDVSSGVESRTGEKDHARMAAFAQAARTIHIDS